MMAVIIICIGLIGIVRHRMQRTNGIPAIAEVTEVKRSTGTRNKYDQVYITFRTEDGYREDGRLDERIGEYKVGDTFEIVYMQNNPGRVYHTFGNQRVYAYLLLIIVGIGLLILGAI